MLQREGGGGAVEAWLRMDDQLHRYSRHHLRVTSLEAKSLPESGARQDLAQPEAQPAREHHRAGAVGKREVSDQAPERMAEAVDRGGGEAILARNAPIPDRPVVERLGRAVLPGGERLVDFANARPRMDPLVRNPQVLPSQPRQATYKAPRAPRPVAAAPRRVAEPAHQPAPRVQVYRDEAPGSATVLTLGAHMCKWPIGDPSSDSFTFCGRRSDEGHPYCVDHSRVAYQPQQSKKKSGANELARSLRRYI